MHYDQARCLCMSFVSGLTNGCNISPIFDHVCLQYYFIDVSRLLERDRVVLLTRFV